jgi:hypothetical protein
VAERALSADVEPEIAVVPTEYEGTETGIELNKGADAIVEALLDESSRSSIHPLTVSVFPAAPCQKLFDADILDDE